MIIYLSAWLNCVFSISKPLHIPFKVPFNVKGMFPQWIEEGKYCSCLLQLINIYWSVLTYPKLLTENWHDLMYKCRKCYGLILFLSDRFQRVALNRKPSNWFHIKAFLPQGSIRKSMSINGTCCLILKVSSRNYLFS